MPSKPRFDVESVRELVRRRVASASVRAIAEDIGLTRGWLVSFLEGRRPYSKTRAALAAWEMRQRDPDGVVTV